MSTWQLQDAKARFSEFVEAALRNGPQTVTRRGVETAVLIPIEDWRRIQQTARPSIKEVLLQAGPRFNDIAPPRRKWKRREPPAFLGRRPQ
jgi:antitoxin Phd